MIELTEEEMKEMISFSNKLMQDLQNQEKVTEEGFASLQEVIKEKMTSLKEVVESLCNEKKVLEAENEALKYALEKAEKKIDDLEGWEDEADDLKNQLDSIADKGEILDFSKILCEEISSILELYLKQVYNLQPNCCRALHQEIFYQITPFIEDRLLDRYCGE